MKKYCIALMIVALYSCGGAVDGDAGTDTTSMPLDTTTGINTSSGSAPVTPSPIDSSRRTPSATPPESRTTTPGQNPAHRQ